jgi:AcrR family transcriptional regulator
VNQILTPVYLRVTVGDMKSGLAQGKRRYRMTVRAEAAQSTANCILDAAIELFTDKAFEDVTLDEVAERAGITKRTVLRRFESKDRLFVAAMDRAVDQMLRQREVAPVGDVVGAVANVVAHYERWGTNRLRLLSQEDRIELVAEHVRGGRAYHRAWVEHTFGPQLAGLRGSARKRRVAALVAATDVYTWKLLRLDLGLSRAETQRTLVEIIG